VLAKVLEQVPKARFWQSTVDFSQYCRLDSFPKSARTLQPLTGVAPHLRSQKQGGSKSELPGLLNSTGLTFGSPKIGISFETGASFGDSSLPVNCRDRLLLRSLKVS
jgi:hypothetical protein